MVLTQKRLAIGLGLAILGLAQGVSAAPVHEVTKTDPLRLQLLDLMRPVAAKEVGAPVVFKVRQFRSDDHFAFVQADAQRPGGVRIDPKTTPYVRANGKGALEMWDCCHIEAIFEKKGSQWSLVESELGSTDVWWEDWCKKLPAGMINECAK
jgi:hypothetical protein